VLSLQKKSLPSILFITYYVEDPPKNLSKNPNFTSEFYKIDLLASKNKTPLEVELYSLLPPLIIINSSSNYKQLAFKGIDSLYLILISSHNASLFIKSNLSIKFFPKQ
jgi:hypothetical protein